MFKPVWFCPALLNQVYGSVYDAPGSFCQVNNVSSSLRRCFHERGELLGRMILLTAHDFCQS
jgi:hypothetical protein